jgi:hypothetical protein
MKHSNKKQFKDFFDGIRAEKIRNEDTTIPLREVIKFRKGKLIFSMSMRLSQNQDFKIRG